MSDVEGTSTDKMFGPLIFEIKEHSNSLQLEAMVHCILCDTTFNLDLALDLFIKHLFDVHDLIIEDIQNIESLPNYLQYWKSKFEVTPIEEIVPAVKVEPSGKFYFLLSTLLLEDKHLRHQLQLEHVLKIQEYERTDNTYMRPCLFCKLHFEGTRIDFVTHLINHHNLQLGNPQNLVHIEELVNKIDYTLTNLTCIFCNRIFPERNILKEHMRKKLHKRINSHNTEYDKYFIKNYLEQDTTQKAKDICITDTDVSVNGDEEYYDWNEKEDVIICLFCNKRETNINTLCLHMEGDHDFDFAEFTKEFNFYQKVKFVNYVRKQMHNKNCLYCNVSCKTQESLHVHLYEEQHCKIPQMKIFDQPEFYFPTFENDAFLYLIDDVED